MPITADQERRLLNHYHLTSLDPVTWPHRHDDDDDDDDSSDDGEDPPALPFRALPGGRVGGEPGRQDLSSRFRNMDRHASVRSAGSVIGSESVVQNDEPDPLGMTPSVVAELRKRLLPVEEDLALRNRFMLTSTSFSPALFLSQVHRDASTDDLLRGLDFLSRSIEQKSASLKVLVESNFEKFVRAKATMDNVYTEMRTRGAGESEVGTPASPGRRQQHSRHTSRGQSGSHFRNAAGAPFSPTLTTSTARSTTARKNALTRESEYGVLGIKAPLQDVAIKAEELWGPALGGRDQEDSFKQVIGALEQYKENFGLGTVVSEAIKKNDYDTIIESWKKANKYADQARQIVEEAYRSNAPITDQSAQIILLTVHAHHSISTQLEAFKRVLWRRLKTSRNHSRPGSHAANVTDEAEEGDEHMRLIAVLLQLGVDENPIWEWLNSRCLYLKDRIARGFERARIEVEILRRRLASSHNNSDNNINRLQDTKAMSRYLRSAAGYGAGSLGKDASGKEMDSPNVVALWEKVLGSMRYLLGSSGVGRGSAGIVGEVVEFWEVTQSFIDGRGQRAFSAAVFAAGNPEHLELEPDDVANLRAGAVDLTTQLRSSLLSFFADAPVDDLSDLYSPVPPTPITPDFAAPNSAGARTPGGGINPLRRAFTFGSSHSGGDGPSPPPANVKTGEWWDTFAFWPPRSNSLSGAHYLGLLLTLVRSAATSLAGLSVTKQQTRGGSAGVEGWRILVGAVRERCVHALCAAWAADADRVRGLETWVRSEVGERRDLTTMPGLFMSYEERVLAGFQRIAYVGDGGGSGNGGGSGEVIIPPPAKLLQAVRGSFVTSLYKALSGMVENAEKGRLAGEGGGVEGTDPDGVMVAIMKGGDGDEVGAGRVDAGNRNVRILLTLSNLSHLRAEIIPHLISAFESSFSAKLTEETKTVRDVLGQIDARLFQAYVKPAVDRLSILIHDGIHSPSWPPPPSSPSTRPINAKPYIYSVLLQLVLVHAEITTTTSTSPPTPSTLTNQILSHLLEQSSTHLLTAFQSPLHPHYTLSSLMQATLDVEFLAQTLSQYTTERAGEIQSQIYLALDERTDDEARKRLQGELPGMRGVLKRLREGTRGEFGCFKRERRRRGTEGRKASGSLADGGSVNGGGSGRGTG
ncbi:Exocyst complex component S5 [Friedmanniomyces endolithicus]|uniref:Exocyst complex component SEC5 n=1 Tax=Friedmanniomyces endolithicus TaxID=329885 RepID=A0AAN6QV23_9PEZI|nr:Exocyst complex component S5 [Friedmanniomyces endolithicus]KAK0990917.1 Exocyst complex component S5 [Friedmanniomyces endolithicus]KAK1027420.1 Exocyst complex component S5 [Friedmanniomyces endolithicus]